MTVSASDAQPVALAPPPARIDAVDVLRGFALFGILVINTAAIAYVPGVPPFFVRTGVADRVAQDLVVLLVESKFFTLFSLLFGLGFAIQLLSAQRRGVRFVPRFSRRMAALLGFGLLHVALLWEGDILVIYAVTGCVLLFFRNRSDRTLLRWAAGLLAVPAALVTVGVLALLVARHLPAFATDLTAGDVAFTDSLATSRDEAIQRLREEPYPALVAGRLADYLVTLPLLLSRIPTVLAMFLLGLYVGRRGILAEPGAHLPLLRLVRRWGLLLGLPASATVVLAVETQPPVTGIVVLLYDQVLTGPLLSLAYAATLVLLLRRAPWRRLLGWLARPGRMALTNYLGQSLLLTLVCYGYGLGLVGRLGWPQALALAVTIFIGQVLLSALWLRRFRYGPLEWLWRTITYWQRQPLLRTAAPDNPGGSAPRTM